MAEVTAQPTQQPSREQLIAQAGFQSLMGQLQQANATVANQAMKIAELELQMQDTISQLTAPKEEAKPTTKKASS